MIRRTFLGMAWLMFGLAALAQKPDLWQPVKEGDGWKFTDPAYGFTLTFPDNYILEANPQAMRDLADYSEQVLPSRAPVRSGPRFTLTDSTRFRPDFVPSLNAVVQFVPGAMTREKFYGQAREQILSGLAGARVTSEQSVTINGTELYRVDYQFILPSTGAMVLARCYAYYDETARVAYAFTLGSSGAKAQEDLEALEIPLRTLRIAPLPAPAGANGPAG